MFSLGEVVVLVAAAAWVFGPNELPRVARSAGRLTGQATGFLYRTRAKFFKFAEETEMNKLHEEVQATMYQLHAIRSELQGGMSLFQPGPLTQRVLSAKPLPGAEAHGASNQWGQAGGGYQSSAATTQQHSAAAAPSAAATTAMPQRQQQQAAAAATEASWAASAVLSAERQAQVQHLQQLGAAREAVPVPGQQQQQSQHAKHGGSMADEEAHPLTMHVSAVLAGLAPDRAGRAPSGSEVLLDALAEEMLAAQVLRFQQQQLAAQAQQAAAQRQAAAQPKQQAQHQQANLQAAAQQTQQGQQQEGPAQQVQQKQKPAKPAPTNGEQ